MEKGDGRLAFLYDSLARLDLPRQRLALGLPSAPGSDPADPLRALYKVFAADVAWWRNGHGAFARSEADAARVLREVRLAEDGTIAPPSIARLLDGGLRREDRRRPRRFAPRRGPTSPGSPGGSAAAIRGWRRLRLEQLAFAQRVFGAAAETAPKEALQALEGLVDVRALVLSLERFGSTDPAFYAAAVAGARSALVFQVPEDLARAHAGFQGALGVIDRARFGGALDTAAAEGLVRSLVQVPLPNVVPWERGLGGWVAQTLVPTLARAVGADAADPDQVLLRAIAGVSLERPASPVFDWEGLWYRAQPERAELRRLEGVRRRQARQSLREVLRDCQDPSEKERHACAWAVGEVLTSFVYAAHLGEPDGAALRGEDPSRRHVFLPDPWALPSEVSGPGVPWHVQGSLLGLETALARLSLHRLDADAMPDRAPAIDAPQRRRLVDLRRPRERDRDARCGPGRAGGGRGRGPAACAGARAGQRGSRRRRARRGLDPWRARGLEWLLEHDKAALASFFSLGELAYLGEPAGGRWDGWGAADPTMAGLRLRLTLPRPLDESSGRRPEPALAEGFVGLGVRAAVHLAQRGLPASLAPALVSRLLPDLFIEARPVAPDDRLALDAWARDQPAERLDDAVAALVGRGPLQPAPAPGRTR